MYHTPHIQTLHATETIGTFALEPLMPGMGVTLGNALRRVLLSSLPGVSISAVMIQGVQHEFSTILGVTEDVSDIILNLKGVNFRANERGAGTISLFLQGPGEWTAKDLTEASADYVVLNPNHHIATLAPDAEFAVELRLSAGMGYVPAADNQRADDPIGVIAVDSLHSPVRRVRFSVRPVRISDTDHERLEITIATSGATTPEEALEEAAAILRDHVTLFIGLDVSPPLEETEEDRAIDPEVLRRRQLLDQSVTELDLSVRSMNCLKAAGIETIYDLVQREEQEMLKFRNFGRKSLREIEDQLNNLGLGFGMNVSHFLASRGLDPGS